MKDWIFPGVGCVVLIFLLSPLVAYTPGKPKPVRMIDSFTDYKVDSFPRRFRTYPFQRSKAKKVYRVKEEGGNQFLRAYDDQDISVQVFRQFHWDIERYPWIRWRWRVRILPVGGDERHSPTNDSACGVYIVFGKYTGKVLKYVWSTLAPEGTVHKKKPGKFHMIVRNSGEASNPGDWQEVVVNVTEDYANNFQGDAIRNPSGFGLLTDGNAVHKPASCDYDEFVISTNPPKSG